MSTTQRDENPHSTIDPPSTSSNADKQCEDSSDKSKAAREGESPSRFPAWITSNLQDSRSLKTLFRCWLASWATFVLILPIRSLEVLGQAAFFASLLTFMIPANMPVSLFLLANFILVLGCCLGWAWSSAAMAASLNARNQVLLQQQLQKTYASISGATNPDSLFEVAIFQGNFLDVRSTAVFGVFLILGAYASGVLQAKLPKLKIGGIFFLIILDIMCSYGPLFPFSQYTLATILLIPIGCSVAISLACQFLIFPETLHTAWQHNLIKIVSILRKTIDMHKETLDQMLTEDPRSAEIKMDPKVRALQIDFIRLAEVMGGQRGFLALEISYGKLAVKDLNQLYMEARTMGVRVLGLNAFFHQVEDKEGSFKDQHYTSAGDFEGEQKHNTVRESEGIDLKMLLPILTEVTRRPLKALDACLESTVSWLENSLRWRSKYNHEEWMRSLEVTQIELRDSLHSFVHQDRLRLVEPYKHLFSTEKSGLSPEAQETFQKSARPLFLCFVLCANLTNTMDQVLQTHSSFLDLARKRPRSRLWFPTGLNKIGKAITNNKGVVTTADGPFEMDVNKYDRHDDDDEHNDEDDKSQRVESQIKDLPSSAGRAVPRDPDALAPTKGIHHVGRFLAACYHFTWSAESIFGIRVAVVSFAIWLIAVIPSSAFFSYKHRGLWALIMSQTAMAMSGGELIFTLAGRLIGTLGGLVLGMLLWYLSCGLAKHGNPYGLAAVCAVGFLPIVFLRIFAPPVLLLPALMLGVTTALCVGYSWIDANLVLIASSGVGYEIAWRRALLVIIGMVAAFIVTIFPKPPSTRSLVRHGFARSSEELAKLYSLVIENWIVVGLHHDETRALRQDGIHKALRAQFIKSQAVLGGLARDIGLANLDISVRGPWPKEKYQELLKIHGRMLESLSQMAIAQTKLDQTWQHKMQYTPAILDRKTINEVSSTFYILAGALRSASPIPPASITLEEGSIWNQSNAGEVERVIQSKSNLNKETMTLERLCDPQFMRHTAATMALNTFVRQLDRFKVLVKDLVGEIVLPGFDELRE